MQFIRVKVSGKLDNGIIIPFHQLPCLIIEGEALAQTAGIARYLWKVIWFISPKK